MGLNATDLVTQAAQAKRDGRSVFIVQVAMEPDDLAVMIEGIEARGWKLDQFTSTQHDGGMTVTCLFRRAGRESKRYQLSWLGLSDD